MIAKHIGALIFLTFIISVGFSQGIKKPTSSAMIKVEGSDIGCVPVESALFEEDGVVNIEAVGYNEFLVEYTNGEISVEEIKGELLEKGYKLPAEELHNPEKAFEKENPEFAEVRLNCPSDKPLFKESDENWDPDFDNKGIEHRMDDDK